MLLIVIWVIKPSAFGKVYVNSHLLVIFYIETYFGKTLKNTHIRFNNKHGVAGCVIALYT